MTRAGWPTASNQTTGHTDQLRMAFIPSLPNPPSVSFYIQFPHSFSSPPHGSSSPGDCRRAQHLLDVPNVDIHGGSSQLSPQPQHAPASAAGQLHGRQHAALQGRGKVREADDPRPGGAATRAPSLWGEPGGTQPWGLRAGPANMASPVLGLVALRGPGARSPAGPACPMGPHQSLGVSGSHPRAVDQPQLCSCPQHRPGPVLAP